MTERDFNDFYTVLSATADMYGKTISQVSVSLWWNALKGYDLMTIRDAMSQHIKNPDAGQWMPKPADIIRMIGGTTNDRALNAWTKVDSAVRRHGTWSDVVFDDPIIHRVIQDMGGWISFGTKTDREWDFVRNEFVTRYRGMTLGAIPEYQSILVGQANLENARSGYKMQAPILIGNIKQATMVLNNGKREVKQIQNVTDFVQG